MATAATTGRDGGPLARTRPKLSRPLKPLSRPPFVTGPTERAASHQSPRGWAREPARAPMARMPKQHLPAAVQLADDGVMTRRALVAAGLNPYLGDRVVRAGAGVRLAPSTYLLATWPTDAQLLAAARAHAGDDLVVTGLLACRLLGLTDVPDDGAIDVLVPAGRRRVSTVYVRVHPTVRPPRCWTHASGVRVADPHRAVVDAARQLRRLQDVRALLLTALCQRWCGLDQLRAELDAGPRNGTALCRRALRDGEAGAWSAPEAEVADVARADPRLPELLLNPTLVIRGRVLGQPDGWFVGLGLGWEVGRLVRGRARRRGRRTPDTRPMIVRRSGAVSRVRAP